MASRGLNKAMLLLLQGQCKPSARLVFGAKQFQLEGFYFAFWIFGARLSIAFSKASADSSNPSFFAAAMKRADCFLSVLLIALRLLRFGFPMGILRQ